MIKLWPYQSQAVNDLAQGLTKHKSVVGWFPTASGKSLIIAELCRRITDKHMGNRVLVLCHTAEILEQNNAKTLAMGLDSGIFCAGLKRKDRNNRIIHASRDSFDDGLFDFIIIDECHLLASGEKTKYQKIIAKVQPRYIIGLTGTPWRLSGGRIFGKNKPFEACVASIKMQTLFDQGFLSPYVVPETKTTIDVTGLKTTAGDFNLAELDAASQPDLVIRACLDQWEELAKGRKFTIIFCCSIEHAKKVWLDLVHRGYRGTYLTEKTTAMDRKRILGEVRNGQHDFLCNVAVLTTGVDIPIIDCVLFLRATQSLSLWIQMLGRGLRLSEGKSDCMMLDCAGNFERLGGPENPKEKRSAEGATSFTAEELLAMGIDPAMMVGDVGGKDCPNCKATVARAAKKCDQCGHLFINHTAQIFKRKSESFVGSVVSSIETSEEISKIGNQYTKIEYTLDCGSKFIEYVCATPSMPEFLKAQAIRKLKALKSGQIPLVINAKMEKNFWKTEWKKTRKDSLLDGSKPTVSSAGETTLQGSMTQVRENTEPKMA
jgi:DNA repair protein RadD